MTITSNTPGQINQALLALAKRKANRTSKVTFGVNQAPEIDEPEVRFYITGDVNYVVMGDIVLTFCKVKMNNSNSTPYSVGGGKYQFRCNYILTTPYSYKANPLYFCSFSKHDANTSSSEYYIQNLWGNINLYGSSKILLDFRGGKEVQICDSVLYTNPNTQIDYIADIVLLGEVSA